MSILGEVVSKAPFTLCPPGHSGQPKRRIVNKVSRKSFPSFLRRGGWDT